MKIQLHIDRLVLDGFDLTAGQSRQLQVAVEKELARLVGGWTAGADGAAEAHGDPRVGESKPPAPPLMQGGATPSVTAGAFDPPRGSSPSQLGTHIAQSIHGGIRQSD